MSYSTSIRDGPLGILPIDVYEHIIDCVHSSGSKEKEVRIMRMTLCSCALTCRAWRPRSRFLLYQSVTLYSSRAYSRNQDVVRRLTHTISSSPFVADLVEHVIISETLFNRQSGIASTLPLLLVNKLPQLRTLTICNTALLVSPAFCHSIASFPALTTLAMTLASVTAFRRLLAALPRLYDLRLEYVAFETGGMWETAALYESQMPRVRRLSIIDPQNALPVLPLLARHVERLVISVGMLKENVFAGLDGLVFDHLTSLTIRSYDALSEDVVDFFSRARAHRLRTIIAISSQTDLQSMRRPELLSVAFGERCVLEQALLKAGLRRLESVTVVLAVTPHVDLREKRVAAEIMEKRMPAAVKECREGLSILHRRGLLRVAAAALGGRRKDEAWICVWPKEECAQAAPSCTWRYGMSTVLDALVNVLDNTPS